MENIEDVLHFLEPLYKGYGTLEIMLEPGSENRVPFCVKMMGPLVLEDDQSN
jgi:hypothetical protein